MRGISLGTMAGVTAILIHSIGDFNLHIPSNALLFSVLAALVMSLDPNLRPCHKSRISCQKIMLIKPWIDDMKKLIIMLYDYVKL